MSANVVSSKRRMAAGKHARWRHFCVCGKSCVGNGGWSSHKRACAQWQAAIEAERAKILDSVKESK